MKKIHILTLSLFLTACTFAQKKDKSCFPTARIDDNAQLNKKIAKEIAAAEKQYAGYHVLTDDWEDVQNLLGVVVERVGFVYYALKKDTMCCIMKGSIVQKMIGHSWGRPDLYESYTTEVPTNGTTRWGVSNDMIKKWRSCKCIEEGTNWLTTSGGSTGGNSDTKTSANLIKNKSATTNVDKYKKTDGPYEKKDENGQIEQSGTYKNQKKQGAWKSFENGKLYLEENYIDDVKNGLETKYSDDGGINYKMEFKDGKQNGAEQFFENSKLKSNNTYLNGNKNGKCTSYYSEGGKYSEENYVDGKLEGLKTEYTAKGEISSTTTYKDDKMNGAYKKFYAGKIEEAGSYLNGMQDGVWKKYDKTGKVTETKTYKDGVPQ